MRQSKIKRQEERRSRQRSAPRQVAQKQEKIEEEGYIVVRKDDIRESKYLSSHGAHGLSKDHAENLAKPVQKQIDEGIVYEVCPVSVWNFANEQDEPLTLEKAMALYAEQAPQEEEE